MLVGQITNHMIGPQALCDRDCPKYGLCNTILRAADHKQPSVGFPAVDMEVLPCSRTFITHGCSSLPGNPVALPMEIVVSFLGIFFNSPAGPSTAFWFRMICEASLQYQRVGQVCGTTRLAEVAASFSISRRSITLLDLLLRPT